MGFKGNLIRASRPLKKRKPQGLSFEQTVSALVQQPIDARNFGLSLLNDSRIALGNQQLANQTHQPWGIQGLHNQTKWCVQPEGREAIQRPHVELPVRKQHGLSRLLDAVAVRGRDLKRKFAHLVEEAFDALRR